MGYIKATLAMLIAGAGAIITAVGNGEISDLGAKEWLLAAAATLGSGGYVWYVENVHGVLGGAVKAIGAFLSAGVASLIFALEDNVISQGEWLSAFVVALIASGLVYQVSDNPPPTP